MNRVILVGRLTRDPELRTSGSVPYVNFTIAVNRSFTSSTGVREADFINCVAFNRQAENLSRFMRKGSQIGVEGRIQVDTYDAQDGTKRNSVKVVCDQITFWNRNPPLPATTATLILLIRIFRLQPVRVLRDRHVLLTVTNFNKGKRSPSDQSESLSV